jgi:hypothetical protein
MLKFYFKSVRVFAPENVLNFVKFIYSPAVPIAIGINSPPTQVVLSPILSRTVTPSLKIKRGGRGESCDCKNVKFYYSPLPLANEKRKVKN